MISIIIATYGDDIWKEIAQRAVISAENQTLKSEVIYVHGDTLAQARNEGASISTGEYLIFLDADDELHEDYTLHMSRCNYDLTQCAIQIGNDIPNILEKKDLRRFNYLIIGTMVKKAKFLGFKEYPAWEDWDLWVRMYLKGARIGLCEKAIYKIHQNKNGRNSSMTQEFQNELHSRMVADHDEFEKSLRIN